MTINENTFKATINTFKTAVNAKNWKELDKCLTDLENLKTEIEYEHGEENWLAKEIQEMINQLTGTPWE